MSHPWLVNISSSIFEHSAGKKHAQTVLKSIWKDVCRGSEKYGDLMISQMLKG